MLKVLLVEDEDLIRRGLHFQMDWTAAGCVVADEARSGEEGLEKIKALRPDVVVTDVRMRDMDGLEMLERGLELGKSLNDAGCAALLAILAAETDTNMIARGGLTVQRETAAQVSKLLEQEPYPGQQTLEALDDRFIQENLSPGGSADLLAVCYLLHFLRTEAL